jgi:hypothetical protein
MVYKKAYLVTYQLHGSSIIGFQWMDHGALVGVGSNGLFKTTFFEGKIPPLQDFKKVVQILQRFVLKKIDTKSAYFTGKQVEIHQI